MNKKRNIVAICIAFVIVAAVTFFALNANKDKGYRTVSVIEIYGPVSVVKDGIEYKAYPGMKLSQGHEIITAGNAYVRMLLDDDKYVKLESGSKLVFEKLGKFGSSKTHLRLERGTITSEIVKPLEKDDEFIVNTPNSILAVRGTFFRIDMGVNEEGEIVSDVMTYGGLVVSKTVAPNGDVASEEVGIEAGKKATIKMDKSETNYVVDTLSTEDISDNDLIDIYFAAENGHKMFATTDSLKTDLETRNINIEEQKSVYEKAKEVINAQNGIKEKPLANDNKPLAKEEATKEEIQAPITDGDAHTHTTITTKYAPTCGKEGKEVISCVSCKEILVETKIDALEHILGEWKVKEEASCTKDGILERKCQNCNYAEKENITSSGHKMSDWFIAMEPTCETVGHKEQRCENCDYKVFEDISTIEHTYEDYFYMDIAPTCETKGEMSRHCKVCDARTEITQVQERGHIYGEWAIVTEAVCGTKGEKQHICTICGYSEFSDYVATSGHTPDNNSMGCHISCLVCQEAIGLGSSYSGVVIEQPTCEKEGVMLYTCECGAYQTQGIIPAEGHDYTQWSVVVAPTCSRVGVMSRMCNICATVEEEEMALGSHEKYDENADVTVCKHCGTDMIAVSLNVIPDENVLQYIAPLCDKDLDGIILGSEMADVKHFDFNDPKYADLTGINNFKQIESLNLEGNWTITDLDLSGCENLKELNLNSCGSLKTLNLSNISGPLTINMTGIAMTPIDFETTINVTKDENLAIYYTVS